MCVCVSNSLSIEDRQIWKSHINGKEIPMFGVTYSRYSAMVHVFDVTCMLR